MIRLALALLLCVVLAGMVHIAAIQAVPLVAPAPARLRLSTLGTPLAFHPVSSREIARDLDPAFRYAVCVYDLSTGPVAIEAAPGPDYWSLSFHDAFAGVHYALNNRSADQGRVMVAVAPEARVARLQRALQEGEETKLVVGAPSRRGYALLKILVPTPSRAAEAAERLKTASCRKLEAS